MLRREFMAGVGGAVVWSSVGRCADQTKTLGLLLGGTPESSSWQMYLAVFLQQLRSLGWNEGRNLRLEYRWAAGNADRMRDGARELVDLRPDAIFAGTAPTVPALQNETSSIPIVFALVVDPVVLGYVKSLARPGRNTTGFTNFEPHMGAKWLALLKEIAPNTTKVGCMLNPDLDWAFDHIIVNAIRDAAPSLAIDVTVAEVRSVDDIDSSVQRLASNGALIPLPGNFLALHFPDIVKVTAQYRVPAIYGWDYMVSAGGLVSYGSVWEDEIRGAASYVDLVFKGADPGALPVQTPTKFKLAINLKVAKTLGLSIPETLLATADEVIQ
jgi:putative tryptophan/tyrosine transport system substrate-binding protein